MTAAIILGIVRGFLGGVLGWAFGDWRRIAALCGIVALIASFVIGDVRGRHASDAAWQVKYDKLSHDFITAANDAKAAEVKRQADIGSNVTKAFQDQLAARDAADAKQQAILEKEIADAKLNAGGGCAIDDQSLRLLNAQP